MGEGMTLYVEYDFLKMYKLSGYMGSEFNRQTEAADEVNEL